LPSNSLPLYKLTWGKLLACEISRGCWLLGASADFAPTSCSLSMRLEIDWAREAAFLGVSKESLQGTVGATDDLLSSCSGLRLAVLEPMSSKFLQ